MSVVLSSHLNTRHIERAFNTASASVKKSTERLSTGTRINRAGDDAAAPSISTKTNSKIKSIDEVQRGLQDFIEIFDNHSSMLGSVLDDVQNIRESYIKLFNMAPNPGTSDEIKMVARDIEERINSASFKYRNQPSNPVSYQMGQTSSGLPRRTYTNLPAIFAWNPMLTDFEINVQLGTEDSDSQKIKFWDEATLVGLHMEFLEGLRGDIELLLPDGNPLTDPATATPAFLGETKLSDFDNIINSLSAYQSKLGSVINGFQSRIDNLDIRKADLLGAKSNYTDTDIAEEGSQMIRSQIQQQSAGSILTQANSQGQFVLGLLP